jgi:hypothetical protein
LSAPAANIHSPHQRALFLSARLTENKSQCGQVKIQRAVTATAAALLMEIYTNFLNKNSLQHALYIFVSFLEKKHSGRVACNF